MTWNELELMRVHGDFLSLSGCTWDAIEAAAWQWRQLYLASERTAARERYRWKHATPSGRAEIAAKKRASYHNGKAQVVAVRGCAECGQPFGVSRVARKRQKDRFCSLSCVAKDRVRRQGGRFGNSIAKQVVIDGESKTRSEWAEHFGLSLVSVHYRMTVRGMSEVEALTTPKTQGRRLA